MCRPNRLYGIFPALHPLSGNFHPFQKYLRVFTCIQVIIHNEDV